ncbi:MAG: MurR/RpiR family transcriptional regulator [Clostridia bacterium]|nr:MurR/RpiR family transcriptional regulator [Clostridia bacterium]
MKRINEAITENAGGFTKGQHLLARFVTEHCDKAAFMSSFDLASVTGVSQSTVIRFASALGYKGFGDFQNAMQLELKYRLNTLERFDRAEENASSDLELLNSIAAHDALNIKKILSLNPLDALNNLCTRMMLSGKIYLYGQQYSSAAANYLASYLRVLLSNVCALNQLGFDPLSGASGMAAGDLLLCFAFPEHQQATLDLLSFAREREVCTATITESHNSAAAQDADISLVAECGDYGLGGSMAPLISLCSMIVCLLAHNDEKAQKKLASFAAAGQYRGKEREA